MTRTILLADDSVTIQKVVELTFLEQDVTVVAVGSGDQALARLDELQPALVIADVHMPGADGFEVCRQVKQRTPSLPVLLLVGTFEPFDEAGVASAGADGHLKKPFDSQELLERALELMGEEGGERAAAGAAVAARGVGATGAVAQTRAAVTPPAGQVSGMPSEPSEPAADVAPDGDLADADVERIARRVVELLSDKAVRDVAWEVVPDLAELLIRDRLRELESQADEPGG